MRSLLLPLALLPALLLAGCSPSQEMMASEQSSLATFNVAEEPPPPNAGGAQIAYSYRLSYTLPDAAIERVQAQHLAACRRLGPGRCLVVKTDLQRGTDADTVRAETQLLVDARLAGGFGQRLDTLSSDAGGSLSGRQVSAEDVTRQVIDTDARVRAKQALAARLLQLIGNARANVGDLVAAEKAFAQTQEELDAARGLQATLRRRVAMSTIDIGYTPVAATSASAPIRRSLAATGATLADSVASLISFVVAATPWLLLLVLVGWGLRRLRRRRRAARVGTAPPQPAG